MTECQVCKFFSGLLMADLYRMMESSSFIKVVAAIENIFEQLITSVTTKNATYK